MNHIGHDRRTTGVGFTKGNLLARQPTGLGRTPKSEITAMQQLLSTHHGWLCCRLKSLEASSWPEICTALACGACWVCALFCKSNQLHTDQQFDALLISALRSSMALATASSKHWCCLQGLQFHRWAINSTSQSSADRHAAAFPPAMQPKSSITSWSSRSQRSRPTGPYKRNQTGRKVVANCVKCKFVRACAQTWHATVAGQGGNQRQSNYIAL